MKVLPYLWKTSPIFWI